MFLNRRVSNLKIGVYIAFSHWVVSLTSQQHLINIYLKVSSYPEDFTQI